MVQTILEKDIMEKVKQIFGTVFPFQNYIQVVDKWKSEHPEMEIHKEIEHAFMGIVQVPDPQMIGQLKDTQALMMSYVCIFTDVPHTKRPLVNG